MVSGITLFLGPGSRTQDPYVSVVFGAPVYSRVVLLEPLWLAIDRPAIRARLEELWLGLGSKVCGICIFTWTQGAQYVLIKECSLKYIGIQNMI